MAKLYLKKKTFRKIVSKLDLFAEVKTSNCMFQYYACTPGDPPVNRVPPKEDRDIAAGVRKLFSLFRGNSNFILTPACCMNGGVKDLDNYTKIVSVSRSLGAVIFYRERTLWTPSGIVIVLVWFLNALL